MLELRHISKAYQSGTFVQKALDGVSVTFRDSEFVAVLGPSGSGKTTMLNVIGGLDHYDSGNLIINGTSTRSFKDQDWDHYRNIEVGFVFQNYNLIPHQTILSNVELALTLSGISSKERKSRAVSALKSVGLLDHINKKPNQLSGGQMQRVAIARALVNNPSIIFADEPTGALDTKTSIQIMDILKEVSKNKLVVMVTHNPELAEKYATRIVNLKDGKIVADSKPFYKEENKGKKFLKNFKKGKTAMSFLTALSLSFANLMGKKGRTFMTAFAGSIGIIGISAILALSTGTSEYIKNVEHTTLSQYPLSITRTKSALSGMSDNNEGGSMSDKIKEMQHNNQEENTIGIRTFVTTLLSASGGNDLKSLKSYIDSNAEGLVDNSQSIEYTYNTEPRIYADDDYGIREVYPEGLIPNNNGSSSSSASSMGAMSSKFSTTSSFAAMPQNPDLYINEYTVSAGRWPENPYECVLVLHQDGTINDTLLYTLGIRDTAEFNEALKNYQAKKKVDLPEDFADVNYNQILGHKFKSVKPSDLYTYDEEAGIWIDNSEDKEFVKEKVKASKDITLVGIITPPEGLDNALALTAGLNYPSELTEISISEAAQTEIVKQQLADPSIDVLTGISFEEEKSDSGIDPNMFSSMFQIDTDAFKQAFKFDTSAMSQLGSNAKVDISPQMIQGLVASSLSEDSIKQIVQNMTIAELKDDQVRQLVILAVTAYNKYIQNSELTEAEKTPQMYFAPPSIALPQGGPGYIYITQICAAANISATPSIVQGITQIATNLTTSLTTVFKNAVASSMANMTSNLADLGQAFTVDKDAIMSAFKFDASPEKLMQMSKLISGSASRTFEGNLSNFGYADTSNPLSITIYPKNFEAKELITNAIDNYNSNNEEKGNKDKVISYSDYAKILMNSITTMIDMITAVLIAFVAISLVVSSIMIGIITYISVLERKKEIGILRAIGARKRDIFNVFNAETFIIGIVAGLIGIGITLIGCIPANLIAQAVFDVKYPIAVLPAWSAVVLIAISVFLTFVAGLIPSTSASKKDPVEAINS